MADKLHLFPQLLSTIRVILLVGSPPLYLWDVVTVTSNNLLRGFLHLFFAGLTFFYEVCCYTYVPWFWRAQSCFFLFAASYWIFYGALHVIILELVYTDYWRLYEKTVLRKGSTLPQRLSQSDVFYMLDWFSSWFSSSDILFTSIPTINGERYTLKRLGKRGETIGETDHYRITSNIIRHGVWLYNGFVYKQYNDRYCWYKSLAQSDVLRHQNKLKLTEKVLAIQLLLEKRKKSRSSFCVSMWYFRHGQIVQVFVNSISTTYEEGAKRKISWVGNDLEYEKFWKGHRNRQVKKTGIWTSSKYQYDETSFSRIYTYYKTYYNKKGNITSKEQYYRDKLRVLDSCIPVKDLQKLIKSYL